MNTFRLIGLLASVSLGTLAALAQQSVESPPAQTPTNLVAAAPTNAPPDAAIPATSTNAPVETAGSVSTHEVVSAPTNTVASAPTNTAETATPPSAAAPEYTGDKGLRLNFRNVPLDMVLNYLSGAAGFIVVQETKVEGKVDVWSQEPLTKEEAVDLLNTILNKNGYAAVQNGRKLTIVSREDAKKKDLPVKVGSDPEAIPKNDEMVTQIIPVRYANALQMIKDLQPLLPTYATLTANESGNALVLTDTQADIRRMAQIVKALDTSISGIATIRVFPLRYADAKDMATELKEIFPAPDTSGRNNMGGRGQFGRFGGPGGMPGGPGGDANTGTGVSEARRANSRVTAVADERTNSLIVSAPDEVMPTIEQLVKEIDTNAENITEVRVFHLTYSDPQEMADLLTSLFPDDSRNDTRSSIMFGGGRGGRGGPFMGMMGGAASAASSTRTRQKGKVTAVADPRTASVIVSAASDLMPQIGEMIAQLDSNPAKKQRVFVYSLENADVDSVQQVLQDMFQSQNNRNTRSTYQNNPLSSRQQNQGYGNTGSTFGSSFGNTGGGMSRGGGS